MDHLKHQAEDVTPTWESIIPFYLQIIKEQPTPAAVESAEKEIMRLAKGMDKFIEANK